MVVYEWWSGRNVTEWSGLVI